MKEKNRRVIEAGIRKYYLQDYEDLADWEEYMSKVLGPVAGEDDYYWESDDKPNDDRTDPEADYRDFMIYEI